MQEQQHSLEQYYKAKLYRYCQRKGHIIVFATREQDIQEGWDVEIDGKRFDLKGSLTKCFTYKKGYKGKFYSPLKTHTEVDYIVPLNTEGTYWATVTKEQVEDCYRKHYPTGYYDGDGNHNYYVKLTIDDLELFQ